MITNLQKMALVALVIAPFGAAHAAVGPITSKSYVDGGLATKQNKLGGGGDDGKVVVATGTAGTVAYRGVDTTVTADSANLVTSGAVSTAISNVVTNAVEGLGALATLDDVSAAEIQSDAVTTAKIMDANVTKAKLALDIQTSLGKADTALQSADLAGYATTASLGTAAFAETTDFDAAGAAAGVQTNLTAFETRAAGFATSAQGALADTALQSADLAGYATTGYADSAATTAAGTVQTNLETFRDRAAGFATSAQGALADTALQSADLAGYATTASLGTAAFAATTDFDAAGAAAGVQTNLTTFETRAAGFATAAQGALADTALQSADIANLAEKATTLAGYGITDAYTKTEADGLLAAKQNKLTCAEGEMPIANSTGGFDCVDVAVTYAGAGG